MRSLRVLLSARDPAGAALLAAVVPALRATDDLAVELAASPPAWEELIDAGERPARFTLRDGATAVDAGGDPRALLEAADALLARVDPHAVLVTISSFGVGLDEALLARASGRPTFALQDYPGDANAIGGIHAGTYFVRDEAAAALTRRRWGVSATPVGSLRHAPYAHLDVAHLRTEARARAGAVDDRPLIGFFAQPPEVPGHDGAFADLVTALGTLPTSPLVLLRGHPKQPDAAAAYAARLAAAGLAVHDATGEGPAEPWLAACDLVTTCYSTCGIDYAFLSARSPRPLGSVLFLLTRAETRDFLARYAGVRSPDGAGAGLGRVAERAEDLPRLLRDALAPANAAAYHAASLRLPRSARLDVVVDAVRAAARGAAARNASRPVVS
ncbi:MAG TPA: hypothetical protein VFE48_13095 [Methylomirabilota bacterium]|nr:hypothetical protein [Methylomirabilota bacterium]